jgi:hypothetical protein
MLIFYKLEFLKPLHLNFIDFEIINNTKMGLRYHRFITEINQSKLSFKRHLLENSRFERYKNFILFNYYLSIPNQKELIFPFTSTFMAFSCKSMIFFEIANPRPVLPFSDEFL